MNGSSHGSQRSRSMRGPRRSSSDRRARSRLRELCDEVLASYRVAQGEDFVSREEREEAVQVLRELTPIVAQ